MSQRDPDLGKGQHVTRLRGNLRFGDGSKIPLHGFECIGQCGTHLEPEHSSALCSNCADPQHFGFQRGRYR